ncbi:hypothetical protein GLOTRDRAFT_58578 [Gloeophyllum trabeum ATCC 11539]|uniref:Proteasome assembly chaperone 3 n=1 Tax=Gloeophyllum trabeum (strain ATCC 11539 / FP-39264 / Madison 617) TaxID=670483 RepID=S7RRP5_GLOTA|nr:uncharacterized protein GLOTRDRAFT_58578 [Gloeophyllum trabeum ATCC 11539]EPQ57310.1 hypothetical protein GLOTRDRAFT_58578 [Gloeophyllum trabeum ATCC 11539]
MSSTTAPSIHVETKYVPPSDSTLPALALQVTRLVGSYMLWVGTTEGPSEEVDTAPLHGSLAKDWACAMPPISSASQASGTSIFASPNADFALAMAQRLATRFKKQIFLSIDVPPAFVSLGQAPRLLLAVERAIVGALKEMEQLQ